jgi:hypothetical protein
VGNRRCRRNPIQKNRPPTNFPDSQLRGGKIAPNRVPTLYEKSSSDPIWIAGSLSVLIELLVVKCLLLGNQLAGYCAAGGDFGGVYQAAGLYCAA